jgi:DNA polymerase
MKAAKIEWAIGLLKLNAAHLVYDNLMKLCSNAIRGTIIAGPGKKLVVADLANIEGRVAAWLAGEEWKLQAFRDYDTITGTDAKGKPIRKGSDLYILAYAKSFNVVPSSVDPGTLEGYAQRQIGKVEELMFQYGGGVGAWITGAATYGIDLDQMTKQVFDTLPTWAVREATEFLSWLYSEHEDRARKRREAGHNESLVNAALEKAKLKARHHLAERTFIACDAIKRLWRAAHPEISSYWKEIEQTVRACIESPGMQLACRRVKIRRDGEWLRVGLPSGRALCYPLPRIDAEVKNAEGEVVKRFPGISYMGVSQYTKKWERIGSYGGKFFENWTQAVACDQLMETMPIVETAGFEIVLTVHDEDVTEAPIDRDDLNAAYLSELLCSDLGWNVGLPLAAAGYTAQRYRKE